jgi:proteasome lid subunit RPN8/RPN11
VRITRQAMEEVDQHASDGYPNEICGALIAARRSDLVTRARRIRNKIVDRARDRYELDEREHIQVMRECDAEGMEIVGYYHSHPDHPAWASETDSSRSWAGYVYLIVSCHKGRVVDANAFMTTQDFTKMHQVPLEVVQNPSPLAGEGLQPL